MNVVKAFLQLKNGQLLNTEMAYDPSMASASTFPQLLLRVQALVFHTQALHLWLFTSFFRCSSCIFWTHMISPVLLKHPALCLTLVTLTQQQKPSQYDYIRSLMPPSANLILLPGIIQWVYKKYGLNEWMNEYVNEMKQWNKLSGHTYPKVHRSNPVTKTADSHQSRGTFKGSTGTISLSLSLLYVLMEIRVGINESWESQNCGQLCQRFRLFLSSCQP